MTTPDFDDVELPWHPSDYLDVVNAAEDEEKQRKKKLWGNVREIIALLVRTNQHILSHLLSGATRTGKTTLMWGIADFYHDLKFKVIILDLPATEGANVCEPGFASLPMDKRLRTGRAHPLLDMVKKVYGEPKQMKLKILRPFICAEGDQPVGLGIRGKEDRIPANVEPFTLSMSRLRQHDWLSLMPEQLSFRARSLLFRALGEMTRESGIQDLLRVVEKLTADKTVAIRPGIAALDSAKDIELETKQFDKRSLNSLQNGLASLLDSCLILPEVIDGQPVKTNLDVGRLLREEDWIVFNFPPAIPTHVTFSLMKYILLQILALRNENVLICIPEASQLIPKQMPEGKEWYVEPMRQLMQIIATTQAKNGCILLMDTQLPDKLDPVIVQSCRFRYFFPSTPGEMERQIRETRATNAGEVTGNMRLLANETRHFSVMQYPGEKLACIRGDCIPRFRTHTTDEGDYDMIYQDVYGLKGMRKASETCDYVWSVVGRTQNRVAYEVAADRQRKQNEELANASEKLKIEAARILELIDERGGDAVFMMGELVKELAALTGRSPKRARNDLMAEFYTKYHAYYPERIDAHKTKLTFYRDKLERIASGEPPERPAPIGHNRSAMVESLPEPSTFAPGPLPSGPEKLDSLPGIHAQHPSDASLGNMPEPTDVPHPSDDSYPSGSSNSGTPTQVPQLLYPSQTSPLASSDEETCQTGMSNMSADQFQETPSILHLLKNKPVILHLLPDLSRSRLEPNEGPILDFLDSQAEMEFGRESFQTMLHLNRREVQVALERLVHEGLVEKVGSGKKTRYRKPRAILHDREKAPGILHDVAAAADLDASELEEAENGVQRPAGSVLDRDPAAA